MRLNRTAAHRERYEGKSYIDGQGRQRWPSCVVWDDDLPGFGMRIHPPTARGNSRKEFVLRYRVGLRERTMSLGTYGEDCTVRQARRAASKALAQSRRGVDPVEALQTGTVEDVAERFLDEHQASAPRKNVPGGD